MSESEITREELLAQYSSGPLLLDAALAGLSESDIDLAGAVGEWTIRQIVHHIVDGDDLWSMCIKAALGNSGCLYSHEWYDTRNTWAETLNYAGRAIEPAMALFHANRSHIMQLLHDLPDAWERYVLYSRAGVYDKAKMTVGDIIESQANHALAHVEDISAVR